MTKEPNRKQPLVNALAGPIWGVSAVFYVKTKFLRYDFKHRPENDQILRNGKLVVKIVSSRLSCMDTPFAACLVLVVAVTVAVKAIRMWRCGVEYKNV